MLAALAGDEGKAAIDKLRTTALLTEIREPRTGGGWTSSYEVHPIVRELAERQTDRAEALRREGHRRAGDHLEQEAGASPSLYALIEAAYHLRQVGEADRAYDLLEPLVQVLMGRGRILDAHTVLAEIGDPASLHPSRAAWVGIFHGDTAVAYGDLAQALATYTAGLAIFERLAKADPSNAARQRDLSVSHNKVGDVLTAQGKLDDALTAYTAGLAIRERLAMADPSNAAWQRDLSVSHNKVGDVLTAQGKLDDALTAYTAGLAIFERLAKADPSNAARQRDLFVSYARLGLVEEQRDCPDSAASYYSNAEKIIRQLVQLDPTNALWQQDLGWIEARLATASTSSSASSKPGSL